MTKLPDRRPAPHTKRIASAFMFLFISTCLFPHWVKAETIPGLGTATFPTSTRSAAAQHDFMRGLLLLHLFEYETAAESFVAAERKDPGFAMAYWGEAMTFNHPVWNELDTKAGQAALARFAPTPEARARRIADPRERAFMSAVEILYSGKGTKHERDVKYAAAMRQFSQAYPNDDEVQLFYALGLLGQSEGVRDVPIYLQAAAIAKAAYMRNSDHPGSAHYWIHAMDDPQHAAGALPAALALSKIAPDAGHAQHMCAHIFLALGRWDDVVHANLLATGVNNREAAADGRPPRRCGHYNYWLEYGYLQQGRIHEAKSALAGCKVEAMAPGMAARARDTVDPDTSSVGSFAEMRVRYLVDTGHWDDPSTGWTVDMSGALAPQFNALFGAGFAAAQAGDLPTARKRLTAMDELLPRLPALFEQAAVPAGDPSRRTPQIQKLEVQAAILAADGHLDQAVTTMRQAAAIGGDLPYEFGPPSPEKPADEYLGELLLKQHQPEQARTAFEASLKLAPLRTESLLGLARAETAMGDTTATRNSYRELLRIWKNAEPGYAPKEEALRSVSATR